MSSGSSYENLDLLYVKILDIRLDLEFYIIRLVKFWKDLAQI